MFKFKPGQLLMTPGVADLLSTGEEIRAMPPSALLHLLHRHLSGDWGDVCAEDAQANEEALQTGARLLSAYHLAAPRVKVWIITEADRSVTTFLLPEEY